MQSERKCSNQHVAVSRMKLAGTEQKVHYKGRSFVYKYGSCGASLHYRKDQDGTKSRRDDAKGSFGTGSDSVDATPGSFSEVESFLEDGNGSGGSLGGWSFGRWGFGKTDGSLDISFGRYMYVSNGDDENGYFSWVFWQGRCNLCFCLGQNPFNEMRTYPLDHQEVCHLETWLLTRRIRTLCSKMGRNERDGCRKRMR